MVGDAPEGKTLWFIARINWGRDPWLVDLGDWPQGRLASISTELTQSSAVRETPPGFTFAPRNPRIFQTAAGAVTNSNLNTLYDQARDRALVFRGPQVDLLPERHDTRSTYFVTARLGGGAESMRRDARIKLLSVSGVDGFITRQVQFFRPMSEEMRKQFPAALSGWLSVYSGLRREDTEKEVLANRQFAEHAEENVIRGADWFVKNLRPDAYGPINIGVNALHGMKEVPLKEFDMSTPDSVDHHRDWRVQCTTLFPHGAKWLADEMHKRGLQLGSWAILDGWDADEVYKGIPTGSCIIPTGPRFISGLGMESTTWTARTPRRLTFSEK